MDKFSELKNKIVRAIEYGKAFDLIVDFVKDNGQYYLSSKNQWEKRKFDTLVSILSEKNQVEQVNYINAIRDNWTLREGIKCAELKDNGDINICNLNILNFFRMDAFANYMNFEKMVLNHVYLLYRLKSFPRGRGYFYFGHDLLVNEPCDLIYMFGIDNDGLLADCQYSIDVLKQLVRIQ